MEKENKFENQPGECEIYAALEIHIEKLILFKIPQTYKLYVGNVNLVKISNTAIVSQHCSWRFTIIAIGI